MSLTGEIRMECDYCEAYMGVIDTIPQSENVLLVGTQFCCPSCYEKRNAMEAGL